MMVLMTIISVNHKYNQPLYGLVDQPTITIHKIKATKQTSDEIEAENVYFRPKCVHCYQQ